jgi:carnitine O-acetyltransferase
MFLLVFSITKKKVLHHGGFGKSFIRKHGVSPDATAQLIKQLAFHRMFGRPGVTYESAQTRKYQLGRTEVIRSVSNESKAWVEEMIKPETGVRPRFLIPGNSN